MKTATTFGKELIYHINSSINMSKLRKKATERGEGLGGRPIKIDEIKFRMILDIREMAPEFIVHDSMPMAMEAIRAHGIIRAWPSKTS